MSATMDVWMVCMELISPPADSSPSKIGFMNITTWADSKEKAEAKIQDYVESLGWHLVSVERSHVVSENREYGDVEWNQIERTRQNPNAIILGTFHTYRAT